MPLTAADLKRRALILKCEFCEYTSKNKNNLKVHTQAEHVKKHVKRVHMPPTAADLKRKVWNKMHEVVENWDYCDVCGFWALACTDTG
jgi:hypothetical protein